MSVKTKKVIVSSTPAKKAAAKSGLKAGSQTEPGRASRGGSVGKAPAKKSVAKKTTVKKGTPVVSMNVEEQVVPVVTVVEKEVQTTNGPVEVHHKYVFIGTCSNCNHLPMSVNELVAVLSVVIVILSGMLISTSVPINFKIPSISISSLSDLIIPDSQVRKL